MLVHGCPDVKIMSAPVELVPPTHVEPASVNQSLDAPEMEPSRDTLFTVVVADLTCSPNWEYVFPRSNEKCVVVELATVDASRRLYSIPGFTELLRPTSKFLYAILFHLQG